ncbi:hypothetical protein CEXT_357141 [Caerostris extrusa]|uniref:Uncharacterized protein n=1 Tax=Caerostris extrusa TaxID=172846 RepID=A0AAV4MFX6_CAEEX|nr:hypothetical protein CEXT_357141 [Caerostris extrusa]
MGNAELQRRVGNHYGVQFYLMEVAKFALLPQIRKCLALPKLISSSAQKRWAPFFSLLQKKWMKECELELEIPSAMALPVTYPPRQKRKNKKKSGQIYVTFDSIWRMLE